MSIHKEVIISEFHKDDLCNLIADVEKYPEFLPWCSAARIISQEAAEHFYAELTIKFKNIKKSYVSEVIITKGKLENLIDVTQTKGPFKYLNNKWLFKTLDDGRTEIDFFIDFELKSATLSIILSPVLRMAHRQMLEAFIKQANKVLESP